MTANEGAREHRKAIFRFPLRTGCPARRPLAGSVCSDDEYAAGVITTRATEEGVHGKKGYTTAVRARTTCTRRIVVAQNVPRPPVVPRGYGFKSRIRPMRAYRTRTARGSERNVMRGHEPRAYHPVRSNNVALAAVFISKCEFYCSLASAR